MPVYLDSVSRLLLYDKCHCLYWFYKCFKKPCTPLLSLLPEKESQHCATFSILTATPSCHHGLQATQV